MVDHPTQTNSLSCPQIKPSSLGKAACQLLGEHIISKALAPGQRLDLDTVSRQLAISKTPIKEALKRLEIEGLIAIEPRSGTYVTDPNPVEIAASFDLRRVLESYAIELIIRQPETEGFEELEEIARELRQLVELRDRSTVYPQYLNLDHRFHGKLVSLAQNPRLNEAHDREDVHSQMARIRYRLSARDINFPQQEHEQLIAALKSQELIAAQKNRQRPF